MGWQGHSAGHSQGRAATPLTALWWQGLDGAPKTLLGPSWQHLRVEEEQDQGLNTELGFGHPTPTSQGSSTEGTV